MAYMTIACPMSLSSELRDRLKATGLSANEIARRSKVPQPVISRFLRGERDLTLTTVERLAEFLGLGWREQAAKVPGDEPEPPKRKRRRRS